MHKSKCVHTTAQYIHVHVCAHVHVYTTVQYVHTCVYKCLHDTNTVTVRHPASTCMYNMPIQLYSTHLSYTDVYRTLPLRETHSASALKECMCSHVCIQMYSTHLQIHVDVHRNLCKHQIRHCMTPIEHLHVKNVHICVHAYVPVCVYN